MTTQEIELFKKTIEETILPIAINMQEEQIKNLMQRITDDNPELPTGFADLVYEQILIMKYNK